MEQSTSGRLVTGSAVKASHHPDIQEQLRQSINTQSQALLKRPLHNEISSLNKSFNSGDAEYIKSLRESQANMGQQASGRRSMRGSQSANLLKIDPNLIIDRNSKIEEKTQVHQQAGRLQREITLIGETDENVQELMRKIEKQLDLATLKYDGQIQNVDLASINKYVGYVDQKLSVKFSTTRGFLRQFIQTTKGQVRFPLQEVILDRSTGDFTVIQDFFDDKGNNVHVERDQIVGVLIPKAGENANNSSSLMAVQRQGRFRSNTEEVKGLKRQSSQNSSRGFKEWDVQELKTVEQITHWLANEASTENQNRPLDFSKAFAVVTNVSIWYFFASSDEERQIWVHELGNLSGKPADSIDFESTIDTKFKQEVREKVMDKIDPVSAFNAWNMSIVCGPAPPSEVASTENNESQKQNKSAQILEFGADYVVFVRDGHKCYISKELRMEPFIVDGNLIKEQGSKIKRALTGSHTKFVVIDFKKQLIRFKKSRESKSYQDEKQIPFNQLLDAKQVTHDDFKIGGSEFHYKLLVQSMKRQFVFIARSKTERQIWITHFLKAIAEGKKYQETKNKLIKASEQGKAFIKFQSENMEVNASSIKGLVMKRIENQSLFHKSDWHERLLSIDYSVPFAYFYKDKTDLKWNKSHKQTSIISCKALTEEDIEMKIQTKKRANSRSLLRIGSAVTHCKWNFGFELEFNDRTYELYSPTRKERDWWVQVLGAIAEMNFKSIQLSSQTPIEYIHRRDNPEEAQLKDQRRLSLQRANSARTLRPGVQKQPTPRTSREQNQSAAAPEDKDETILTDEQIFKQVHEWLHTNQQLMGEHVLEEQPSYKSDFLELNAHSLKGECFQVTNFGEANLLNYPADELRPAIQSDTRMVKLSVSVYFQTQICNFEKVGFMTALGTHTFNQLENVGVLDLKVPDRDLKRNSVDRDWCHNFKLVVAGQELILACASFEDRAQWVRVFQLLLQMKSLEIDFGKISPFTFEHFKRKQFYLLTMGQKEDPQEESKQEVSIGDFQPGRIINSRLSPQKIESEVLGLESYYSPTFSLNSHQYIEGYLVKEIETKKLIQITKEHLRFFRIVFSSGKLNVKENRENQQMRSFFLKDLVFVEEIPCEGRSSAPWAQEDISENFNLERKHPDIWTKDVIERKFPIQNKEKFEDLWPYLFRLDFVDRRFTLCARSRREQAEWMRVFNLILAMNKVHITLSEQNPYAYEAALNPQQTQTALHSRQQSAATQQEKIEAELPAQNEEVRINFDPNVSKESIVLVQPLSVQSDEGLRSPLQGSSARVNDIIKIDDTTPIIDLQEPHERSLDPENQDSQDNKELLNQSVSAYDQPLPSSSSRQKLSNARSRKYKATPSKERKRSKKTTTNPPPNADFQPAASSSGMSSSQTTVVNQNITVQNITIHNMNFPNQADSTRSEQAAAGTTTADETNQNQPNNINSARSRHGAKRPASAVHTRRPQSSRAKKQQKRRRDGQDAHQPEPTFTSAQNQLQQQPYQNSSQDMIDSISMQSYDPNNQSFSLHSQRNKNKQPQGSNNTVVQGSSTISQASSSKFMERQKLLVMRQQQELSLSTSGQQNDNIHQANFQVINTAEVTKKVVDLQAQNNSLELSQRSSVIRVKEADAQLPISSPIQIDKVRKFSAIQEDLDKVYDDAVEKTNEISDPVEISSSLVTNLQKQNKSPLTKSHTVPPKLQPAQPHEVTQIESFVEEISDIHADSVLNKAAGDHVMSKPKLDWGSKYELATNQSQRQQREVVIPINTDNSIYPVASRITLQSYKNLSNQPSTVVMRNKGTHRSQIQLQPSIQSNLTQQQQKDGNQSEFSRYLDSDMGGRKISLSKIRLQGSTKALASVRDAKSALEAPMTSRIQKLMQSGSRRMESSTGAESGTISNRVVASERKVKSKQIIRMRSTKEIENRINKSLNTGEGTYGLPPQQSRVNLAVIKKLTSQSKSLLKVRGTPTKIMQTSATVENLNPMHDDDNIQIQDL